MTTIQPTQLLVTSSDVILDKATESNKGLKTLRKGQVVEAKVLKVLSDRRSQIQIRGEAVTAKTYLPLKAGQTMLLKVDRTGAEQVLKWVEEKSGATADNPRTLLKPWGKSGPYSLLPKLMTLVAGSAHGNAQPQLKDLLTKFNALFDQMAPRSNNGLTQNLMSIIRGSGLLWEAKLANVLLSGQEMSPESLNSLISGDLKGLSLQMLKELANTNDPVAGQLKSFVDGLEKQQLFNQHHFEKFGKYLLPLPFFSPPDFTFGQLLLDLGEQTAENGKKRKETVNISLLLSLTRLGDFRADFSVFQKSIMGVFGVTTEDVRQLVNRWTPDLVHKLKGHGFSAYNISCRVLGPETLSGMTLVDEAASAPRDGLLNLII